MLFNSYIFIGLFMPVCLGGFYLFARGRSDHWMIWLSLCSVVFYGYWSLIHLAIFLSSIIVNFALSRHTARKSRPMLALGITANLALLGYFKYTDFLIGMVNSAAGADITLLGIVLPIGISFFTFQQIAYLVDTYRGTAKPAPFLRYFFFVSFFPQLIAGPIVHHSETFPQLNRLKPHIRNFAIGFSIFALGLFKKVIIADTLAIPADTVFTFAENGGQPTFIEAWIGTLAYTLQIYFDFSAYSDMAIGLARMFGLRLPQNFASPYKARSITDFWKRWHITLSRFLRDYLYIPLGGNRKGKYRTYTNVMITMLLGGLWHGASWNFVLWGALHGVFIGIQRLCAPLFKLPATLGWAITMLVVTLSWVPFRAADMSASINIWKGLFFLNGIAVPAPLAFTGLPTATLLENINLPYILIIAMTGLIAVTMPNVAEIFRRYNGALKTRGYETVTAAHAPAILRWRAAPIWAFIIMTAFLISLMKLNDPSTFLYFQF